MVIADGERGEMSRHRIYLWAETTDVTGQEAGAKGLVTGLYCRKEVHNSRLNTKQLCFHGLVRASHTVSHLDDEDVYFDVPDLRLGRRMSGYAEITVSPV